MTQPDAFARAAERYHDQGPMALGFAQGKLGRDPAYRAVLQRLPPTGSLVDLGCGEGYLLALVRESRPDLRCTGVDHDERRIASARAALQGEPVTLDTADARSWPIPAADVIVALDVLHYQSHDHQRALLQSMAAALNPGGQLLIRDLDPDAGLRSWLTIGAERVAMALGRHRGDGVYPLPPGAMANTLQAAGLGTQLVPCDEGTPFANRLLVGSKR